MFDRLQCLEWRAGRDVPSTDAHITRIETCDDSQTRSVLWGSDGFLVAVLIPLSCILTSVLASCSVSTALSAPQDAFRYSLLPAFSRDSQNAAVRF
jgi:hypothetical protein